VGEAEIDQICELIRYADTHGPESSKESNLIIMAKKIKVSVILISYNHAKYLHETITGILAQTFADFELVIWDDASTDESWQIITSFSDPRVKIFRNEVQKGSVWGINKTISELALGEYIAICHSDNVWEPQKLEKQVAFLDANPQIGAAFSWAQIIDETGQPLQDENHVYHKVFEEPNRTRHEWLNYFFYHGNALCHPSVLIRKVCYDKCGLYRYGFVQLPDFDMGVRLCLKYDIHILPEKLIRFRVQANEENASKNRSDVRIRSYFEFFQVLNNFRNNMTFQELIKAFPDAQKYSKPDGHDSEFALGMTALDAQAFQFTKLFGLTILLEAVNNHARAARLRDLYGFTPSDLIVLTGRHDIFSIELTADLSAQVKRLSAQAQTLSTHGQTLSAQVQSLSAQVAERERKLANVTWQLDEIKSSKKWRFVQFLGWIKISLIPPGSLLERVGRKALQIFRKYIPIFLKTGQKIAQTFRKSRIIRAWDAKNVNRALDQLAKKIKMKPVVESPMVSIIIPVHNQIEYTLNCLLALAASQAQTDYEVIVIDDASDDRTTTLLGDLAGIRYIRNTTNLGFLASCNAAAKSARGAYLVFLNNDTRVQAGWLDNLLESFSLHTNTGLVGSKLIFPDGKLQEAGGIIWADGSAMHYGRNDDPKNYLYNYVREVDYVSGASMMLPKTLWESLDGFHLQYQPAYYEDVDLAFRVRQAGYKVIYQPFSQLTHYEGLSNGTDLNEGVKRHQVINKEKFFEAWQQTISGHGLASQTPDHTERERIKKGQVLFIDDGAPRTDRYAGAVLSEAYMTILREAGFAVTFLPHIDLHYSEKYTRVLQKKGIECVYQPYLDSSEQYIKRHGYRFDYVVISRANVAAEVIDVLKEFAPNARIIFNTIDLHFMRIDRAAQLSNKPEDIELARQARETEVRIIEKVNCTLVVSDVEEQLLKDLLPNACVKVVPFPAELHTPQKGFDERKDIVFLGGFMHKPNVDAVLFFTREIWPLIVSALPEARFVIAGADVTKEIKHLESDKILVKGYVENLLDVFATAKLSVAPIRFGAGIKGKVLASLGYGVPCVATSMASEGIGLTHNTNIMIADTPVEYAEAVIKVYKSAELWKSLSSCGHHWIREKYSRPAIASKLLEAFDEI
jgi:GT2 family glycosyltransferase